MSRQPRQPSPNRLFWQFQDNSGDVPWRSKQARRLYDAAIRQETAGEDIKHAVTGSVKVARKPDNDKSCPYGTLPEAAERFMRSKIVQIRRMADRMERELNAWGGSAFTEKPVAFEAPSHPFDAEYQLMQIIQSNPDRIWIHGVEFARDESGAFVEIKPKHI
jgi:hypothetical protein